VAIVKNVFKNVKRRKLIYFFKEKLAPNIFNLKKKRKQSNYNLHSKKQLISKTACKIQSAQKSS